MNKIFTVDEFGGEIVSIVVYHNKIIVATRRDVWELEETDKEFHEVRYKGYKGQEGPVNCFDSCLVCLIDGYFVLCKLVKSQHSFSAWFIGLRGRSDGFRIPRL